MSYQTLVKEVQKEIAKRTEYGNKKIRYEECQVWKDGDQINLWTYWQGYQLKDIDENGVDILLVGQDWGSPSKNLEIMDNIKRIQSGDPEASYLPDKLTPTDQNLINLFEELGCHITDKNPGKGEPVSMTILEKICDQLDCDFGEIVHFEKKQEETK